METSSIPLTLPSRSYPHISISSKTNRFKKLKLNLFNSLCWQTNAIWDRSHTNWWWEPSSCLSSLQIFLGRKQWSSKVIELQSVSLKFANVHFLVWEREGVSGWDWTNNTIRGNPGNVCGHPFVQWKRICDKLILFARVCNRESLAGFELRNNPKVILFDGGGGGVGVLQREYNAPPPSPP